MKNYLTEALEIVRAQASVRTMTEEEIVIMVTKLAEKFRAMGDGNSGIRLRKTAATS